ncbi:hypothetical protein ACHQM5_026060 [Ranunculus cassubicifolius]
MERSTKALLLISLLMFALVATTEGGRGAPEERQKNRPGVYQPQIFWLLFPPWFLKPFKAVKDTQKVAEEYQMP